MVDIRPNQLPDAILPLRGTDELIVDQGTDGVRKAPPSDAVNSVAPVATQSEAVAGADNVKRMTSLRTKQSIASEVGISIASSAQGSRADSAVQSVNGKTGNSVTLVKGDVGLGNVDNTSDANKPISTATQNALDTKANSSVTISAGTGLEGGGSLSSNRTISLNASVIASLAKADSSVQTVNGVTPTGGNVNVAGGIPDDGSVTDPKLPAFDQVNSPSSSKIRFISSTSSVALAGAIIRPVDAKLSESLSGSDFGIVADGVVDDTTSILNAFNASKSTGRPLFLPKGTILVDPDILVINPNENCVKIFGSSAPTYTSTGGTVLKANSSGSTLFKIDGFSEGHNIGGILFDCDNLVDNGILINSVSNFILSDFGVKDFKLYGMNFTCNEPDGVSVTWSSNFTISRFFLVSDFVVDYGAGILMSGRMDTLSPPGPADPHLFTFIQGRVQINKGTSNPTFGADFGFVDSGQFYEVDFVGSGGGTLFNPTRFSTINNVGEPFPANLSFHSCSMQGGTVSSDGLHGRIYMAHFTTGDGETIPQGLNKIYGFTDQGYMFGNWSIEYLSNSLLLNGTASSNRTIQFTTPDGTSSARIVHNSTLGLEIHLFNGSTYETLFRFHPDGSLWANISGVGFRQITAGALNSGGTGFRQLVVAN